MMLRNRWNHGLLQRWPLVFADKVHRSKALLKCEEEALDFSGDVDVIGWVAKTIARCTLIVLIFLIPNIVVGFYESLAKFWLMIVFAGSSGFTLGLHSYIE